MVAHNKKLNLPPSKVKANYLHWHKGLEGDLFCMDIDSIEVRKRNGVLEPVAIIETQNANSPLGVTYTQRQIYPILAEKLNVPLYLCRTNKQLSFFQVRVYPSGDWILYEPKEYATFLQGL